jgi:hypothetical protein
MKRPRGVMTLVQRTFDVVVDEVEWVEKIDRVDSIPWV